LTGAKAGLEVKVAALAQGGEVGRVTVGFVHVEVVHREDVPGWHVVGMATMLTFPIGRFFDGGRD
jgi:hypothetical protein